MMGGFGEFSSVCCSVCLQGQWGALPFGVEMAKRKRKFILQKIL